MSEINCAIRESFGTVTEMNIPCAWSWRCCWIPGLSSGGQRRSSPVQLPIVVNVNGMATFVSPGTGTNKTTLLVLEGGTPLSELISRILIRRIWHQVRTFVQVAGFPRAVPSTTRDELASLRLWG